MSQMNKLAPGPKGQLLLGSLLPFSKDSLGFLGSQIAEHGDFVRLRFAHITAHLINDPDIVEEVLLRRADAFDKNTRSVAKIQSTCGDSLLSANEPAWARHRKLVQPMFLKSHLEPSTQDIVAATQARLDTWVNGPSINIVTEMMHLLIDVSAKILFGTTVDADVIEAALDVLLADTWRRIQAPVDAADISPALHRPGFKKAVAKLDEIIFRIIETRRQESGKRDDVLSRLLAAHEAEGETQLSDKELRDAAVTLLLAGHETTANALSWTFIRTAQAGLEACNPADLFSEAVRLYPSIWIIERRVKADMELGGYALKRGSSVMISPYFLHRRAQDWDRPKDFDPMRFTTDTVSRLSRCAYMPFGLGRHSCVGRNMATLVAENVLSTVYSQARLKVDAGQRPMPDPGITLRFKTPVMMTVKPF